MGGPAIKDVIAGSALPPRLSRRVLSLAHRTRLRNSERAVAAEMLCQEASDRLAEGESEDAILATLKPKTRVARQLRRTLLSGRPIRRLWWWILSWNKRSLVVGLAAFAIAYPYFFWRFHTGKPVLSRNIAAEHNARLANIPDADRAAPLYREAFESLETMTREDRGTLDREWPAIYPGDPLWPEATAYLDRNQTTLSLVRRAAAKPYAAFPLSLRPHLQPDIDAGRTVLSTAAPNPPVLDLALDSLGPYRSFTRLLQVDARAAAEAGDGGRCVEDLLAMFGLARHAEEHEATIAQLVSLAILQVAALEVGDVIAHHPDLLDREQLEALAGAFREYRAGDLTFDTKPEADFLYDITQRMYTDDGHGDGRLCADGLREIDRIGGGEGRLNASGMFFGPVNSEFLPSRREFTAKYTTALATLTQFARAPLWQWATDADDAVRDAVFTEQEDASRFFMLQVLLPALGKAAMSHQLAAQHRDAALTLLACTRYRLDHGAYPTDLQTLVPEYLGAVPVDHYDGGPIKLRTDERGPPIVYSVGADRTDNGGVPREGDDDGTDAMLWVRPSHAAAAPPGDWILLPAPRPAPYADDD